jgi:Domain of unknown function (DUF6249)
MAAEPTLTLAHLAIPLLALSIPIVAIVAHYLAKAYGERQRHQTLREFARAGLPVPPELLAEVQPQAPGGVSSPTRWLAPALLNLGLGLGLMGMFAVISPGSWLWAIGFVPLGLGLALLLLWRAVRKPQPTP